MPTGKELREQRVTSANAIKQLRDKAHKPEGWTTEDRAAWDAANAEYNRFSEQIEIAERAEHVEAEQNKPAGDHRIGRDDFNPDSRSAQEARANAENQAMALQAWARHGEGEELEDRHLKAARAVGINPRAKEIRLRLPGTDGQIRTGWQFRAMSVATPSAGGYTVADGFMPRLEIALLAYGGVLAAAEVIRTETGEPLPWPTANDTSNTGERIGENTAVAEADPTVGSVTLGSFIYSSKAILVSRKLLRDNAVNLANQIGSMAGERIGRKFATDSATGTGGGSEPQGIVTGATLGATTASATAIAYDELFDLEHSVDPAYRDVSQGAGYMMHDQITLAIRKLKNGDGGYLWQGGDVQSGKPDRLNGYPIFPNQAMASSVIATAKTILFGMLNKYKVRQVGDVMLQRLEERYAEKYQVGFIAFAEMDGALLDAGTHPIKYLQQHA